MKKASSINKFIIFICVVTLVATVLLLDVLKVEESIASSMGLPEPNVILEGSEDYSLPILKGLTLDPDNPLNISFLIDTGNKKSYSSADFDAIIKYFMAALTIPKEQLWVNLSPYEDDRVLELSLSKTDLGRDMMAQDYMLKQISSSLTRPGTVIGDNYWKSSNLGSQFNKVWIVPDIVKVYEHGKKAVIAESSLKVQTEQDYLAMKENGLKTSEDESGLESLIDELNYEVNQGKHFAKTRQIFNSIIMALWFKQSFSESFYKFYLDSKKVKGIDLDDIAYKEKIFELFLKSSNKGVYDLHINKIQDNEEQRISYFSGGQNYINTLSSSSIESNVHKFNQNIDIKKPDNYVGDPVVVETKLSENNKSSEVRLDIRSFMLDGFFEFKQKGRSYLYTNRISHLENGDNAYVFEIFDITDKDNHDLDPSRRVKCVGFNHMGMKQVLGNNIETSKKLANMVLSFFIVTNNNDAYVHYRFPDKTREEATFTSTTQTKLKQLGINEKMLMDSSENLYMWTNNAIEVHEDYRHNSFGQLLFASTLAYAKTKDVNKFAVIDTGISDFFARFIKDKKKLDVIHNGTQDYGPMEIRHDVKFSLDLRKDHVNWDRLKNSQFDLSLDKSLTEKSDKRSPDVKDNDKELKKNSSSVGGIDFQDTKLDISSSSLSDELVNTPFKLEGFQGFEIDITAIKKVMNSDQLSPFVDFYN